MVKPLQIVKHGDKLHVEGYPDAVALKRIDHPIACELQAIALHYDDLSFCRAVLAQIDQLDRVKELLLVEALWVASVSRYFKCFGNSKSRTQLSSKEVLKAHPGAIDVFNYFKQLRNKHVIHDENAYSQSFAGIVLNSKQAQSKVADVISVAMNAFLDDKHFVQFSQLVEVSLEWVTAKRDELHGRLWRIYEQWKYDDLLALPEIRCTVPLVKEVNVKR